MGKLINLNMLYSIRLSLDAAYPSIWRRILIHKETSLYDLHRIIQIVFCWSASHEHNFEFTGLEIDKCADELEISLKELYLGTSNDFYYFYGPRQEWGVQVEIESETKIEFGTHYPHCIDGELSTPNEKCGSIHGYYAIISALNNPNHPKYAEFIDSFGTEQLEIQMDMNKLNTLLYACFRKL